MVLGANEQANQTIANRASAVSERGLRRAGVTDNKVKKEQISLTESAAKMAIGFGGFLFFFMILIILLLYLVLFESKSNFYILLFLFIYNIALAGLLVFMYIRIRKDTNSKKMIKLGLIFFVLIIFSFLILFGIMYLIIFVI